MTLNIAIWHHSQTLECTCGAATGCVAGALASRGRGRTRGGRGLCPTAAPQSARRRRAARWAARPAPTGRRRGAGPGTGAAGTAAWRAPPARACASAPARTPRCGRGNALEHQHCSSTRSNSYPRAHTSCMVTWKNRNPVSQRASTSIHSLLQWRICQTNTQTHDGACKPDRGLQSS